jgi:hypothetical protein
MFKKIALVLAVCACTIPFTSCILFMRSTQSRVEQTETEYPEVSTATSRYTVFNENLNWNDAKKYCEELGGHLVTITSQEEQDVVAGLLSSLDDNEKLNCYFMGAVVENLDGENNKKFEWVTGEAFNYTNWKTNEPKTDKGEKYLQIFAKTYEGNSGTTEPGKWNDSMVDGTAYDGAGDGNFFSQKTTGFICEWDNKNE